MNRIKAQRQWTPRERAELRQLRRQNVDYATLAQHFGRITRAIASQVYQLDARGFRRPWKAADYLKSETGWASRPAIRNTIRGSQHGLEDDRDENRNPSR